MIITNEIFHELFEHKKMFKGISYDGSFNDYPQFHNILFGLQWLISHTVLYSYANETIFQSYIMRDLVRSKENQFGITITED